MNVNEAMEQACAAVGIKPTSRYRVGQWAKTDTLDGGKSGKGDGRVMVDEVKVIGYNWRTGEKQTVFLNSEPTQVERKQMAERQAADDRKKRERTAQAAEIANEMISRARQSSHPYFAKKGFPGELGLVLPAADIKAIGGEYLVAGDRAIIMPVGWHGRFSSVQIVWEDGTKKFLAGGSTQGCAHKIGSGREVWLCEGFATGLSVRLALGRPLTILCCFSASNVYAVSQRIEGPCYIAADNDKPMEQFGWLGTGEHYAKMSGRPYTMPPEVGTDFNDMQLRTSKFVVQKHFGDFIRRR